MKDEPRSARTPRQAGRPLRRRPPPGRAREAQPGPPAGPERPQAPAGALLRRLLAIGDWVALIAALCVATAATSTTDVGTLFWAALLSPVWILVVKLHGLYDNDHRRIRHSTLDELSGLVSACALGTLALDGLLALSPVGPLSPASAILVGIGTLLGSFVAAGGAALRLAPPTGIATGIVIGPAAAVDDGRPPGRHPPGGASAAGRLPGRRRARRRRRAAAARLDRRHREGRFANTRSSASS